MRPLLGRERIVWRAIGSPRLRHAAFRDLFDTAVYGLLCERSVVHFIQIGSNDGRTNDPLWTFRRYPNWRGVLVEPLAPAFRRLAANYAQFGDRFLLVNAAVAPAPGRSEFFVPSASHAGLPAPDQLGSLKRELVLRHLRSAGLAADHLETTSVSCTTFDAVCARLPNGKLDVLHIDAEGSDGQILLQVDLGRWRPSLILFEHLHLPPETLCVVHDRLGGRGYRVQALAGDTLAVVTDSRPPSSGITFVHTLLDRMESAPAA